MSDDAEDHRRRGTRGRGLPRLGAGGRGGRRLGGTTGVGAVVHRRAGGVPAGLVDAAPGDRGGELGLMAPVLQAHPADRARTRSLSKRGAAFSVLKASKKDPRVVSSTPGRAVPSPQTAI